MCRKQDARCDTGVTQRQRSASRSAKDRHEGLVLGQSSLRSAACPNVAPATLCGVGSLCCRVLPAPLPPCDHSAEAVEPLAMEMS